MRWTELFADLEGRLAALEQAELEAEIADRSRAEMAQVTLVNRLRAATGSVLGVTVTGAGVLVGTLQSVGADWLLLDEHGTDVVVVLNAVLAVADLDRRSVPPATVSEVGRRLRVTSVLRALVRDRVVVRCRLRDGSVLVGTPARVGADHLDLAEHEADEAPRPGAVRKQLAVPLHGLAEVRRSPSPWA